MNVAEVAKLLSGSIVSGAEEAPTREALGGYVSDLLSDVMGNALEGDVWITMQKHINVIAVAKLKVLASVILVNGRQPDAETVTRAESEGVVVISTPLAAFDAAGILFAEGLRARRAS